MPKTKINTNHVDTHMRIHQNLRNCLIDAQDFYNNAKDDSKANISMNTLCNIHIPSLQKHLERLNEVKQRTYLINKIREYEEIIEKSRGL